MSGCSKEKDYRRTKAFRTIRAEMIEKLAQRGMDEPVYVDKVDEYMDFWVRRLKLRDDVDERGLTVTDERGRISENRSVSQETQVSRHMLALFIALGFKPDEFSGVSGDDDEL